MVSWAPLKSGEALELLSWKYPDPRVRQFAVAKLESVSNEELADYLPQLIQVHLQLETIPTTSQGLKTRKLSLQSSSLPHTKKSTYRPPLRCSHILVLTGNIPKPFPMLTPKSEIHGPHSRRYQILLEAYLLGCGNSVRTEIMKQDGQIGMLTSVCHHMKDAKPLDRDQVFKQEMEDLQFDQTITLPLGRVYNYVKLMSRSNGNFAEAASGEIQVF
jgi:phosphatidylinositol-4,5-bisphosphate 3-kinase